MEECKRFKDLILTDYMDGEIVNSTKDLIDAHLLVCSDCRRLTEEIRNLTVPLREAKREAAPAYLWSSIKERIEKEISLTEKAGDFITRLVENFFSPRLAPVMATIAVSLLVGSIYFNHFRVNQIKDKEQGEYLIYLMDSAEAFADSNNNGSESPIETYFL